MSESLGPFIRPIKAYFDHLIDCDVSNKIQFSRRSDENQGATLMIR